MKYSGAVQNAHLLSLIVAPEEWEGSIQEVELCADGQDPHRSSASSPMIGVSACFA